MENSFYEINVYSENQVGLLATITSTFSRRSLNIEKLMAYPTRIEGISRLTIKTRGSERDITQVVKQLEKKVDVVKAFYYLDDEREIRELATVSEIFKERSNRK